MPNARPALLRTLAGATIGALTLLINAAPIAHAEGNGEPLPVTGINSCAPMQPDPNAPENERGLPTKADIWHLTRLKPELIHNLGITGAGVSIAVIDTGVAVEGMKYLNAKSVTTRNYIPYRQKNSQGQETQLDCTHGTIVTSLIVGNRRARIPENSTQVPDPSQFVGIAPGATVIAMRTLPGGTSGGNDITPVVRAIRAAIEAKVQIINISQSAGQDILAYRDAIEDANKAGIIVVAAAGNDGDTGPSYPAAYPGVIAVGMTDRGDSPASNTQVARDGWTITVAAPGVDLIAPAPSNDKTQLFARHLNGTSYAAPLVTGTIALMLQQEKQLGHTLTREQVIQRLQSTADPVSSSVPDRRVGWGIVNPYRALFGSRAHATPDMPTPVERPLPQPKRPPASEAVRITALSLAGGALAITLLAVIIYEALPFARQRHFRPAGKAPGDEHS